MPEIDLRQRALGAYLGLAVGDALGATVEFMSPEEIASTHGVHDRMVGGGWLRLAPGAVTDDTEMSLFLGASIVRERGFVLSSVASAFVQWLRGGPIDCGHTCRRGIRRFMLDGSLMAPPRDGDAGNGAGMRNLPVVLATLGDDARFEAETLAQCRFTHNHPHSDAAALCLGRMTHSLLLGEGKAAALRWADALSTEHGVFDYAGYTGPATAYVAHTANTVLSQFARGSDFAGTLVATINRGDDADTTGALQGMLSGALYGVRAIPDAWLNRLDRKVKEAIEAQVPALLSLSPACTPAD